MDHGEPAVPTKQQAPPAELDPREAPAEHLRHRRSSHRHHQHGASQHERSTLFDRAIHIVLMALLTFATAALGGVYAWSELVILIGAGLLAVLLTLKLLVHPDRPFVRSWLHLPVLLLIFVAALQLVPLPSGIVARISPETAAIRQRLLGDLPTAPDVLDAMPLSLYPAATRTGLRMLLAAGVIMVVVPNVFRTPRQIKRLLIAIVVIGAAVAVLAVAQTLSGTTRIYWTIEIEQPALGGTFVNRNNLCQFMNLCIGAALALLLIRLDDLGLGRHSFATLYWRLRHSELWFAKALVGMVVIGAISIFLSASRGGTISLLGAFALTAVLAGARRDRSALGWAMLVLALVMLVGVLYVGFDVAAARLSTLSNLQEAGGERFLMNRDVLAMLPRFPLIGIGFNAHEAVYPMFSRLQSASIAGSLENEYLQLLEETGLIGALLLITFLLLLLRMFVKVLTAGRLSTHAAAFGIAFGIVAVLIHSMSDFGLRIPAIGCLAAVMIGLLISLSRLTDAKQPADGRRSAWGRVLTGVAGVAILAALLVNGVAAFNAAVAESHWNRTYFAVVELEKQDWQGTDQQYAALLREAAAAADAATDNAHYLRSLNEYRWRALARQTDPRTGQFVLTDRTAEFVRRIVSQLQLARVLSPTDGRIYATEGQLQLFVLGQPHGAKLIRTGHELAPTDPTATFVAAALDARQGRWDESVKKFRRAVTLGRQPREVVQVYLQHDRADLAMEFAGDDINAVEALVSALTSLDRHRDILERARSHQKMLIRREAQDPGARADAVARAAALLAAEGDHPAAIDAYRRALARSYTNVSWRLALARSLAAAGQTSQAMQEVRTCLRLRPNDPTARRMLEELSVATTPPVGSSASRPGQDQR